MRVSPVPFVAALLLGLTLTPAAPAATRARSCAAPDPALPPWARHRTMTVLNDSVLLSDEAALRKGMPCWRIRLIGRPALMLRAAEREIRTSHRRVAELVVIGLGYNSLWERHRRRYDHWAARFDSEASRLLHTLRRAGARQFIWVTLRDANRATTAPGHWDELGLYSWYFPYVNERLRRVDRLRDRVVLADWASVGARPDVTYDSIHLNLRGGRLMQQLIEKTLYVEARRQIAPPLARAAQAPCSVTRHRSPQRRPGSVRPPLVVGDSSELLAVDPLVKLGIEADARGCRQTSAAVDILSARKRAGSLPRVAVLGVGANGAVPSSDLRRALRTMGPRGVLALVTTPTPVSSAQAMRAFHARHPNRTILIDWGGSGIPRRYGGDGLHIGYAGEARLARFIYRRVRPYTPPKHEISLPGDSTTATSCGTVHPGGTRRAVYVIRGRGRILCSAARALVRSRNPATVPNFNWFNWRFVGTPPWTDVFARYDGRVIVAARPPPPAPAPGTDQPAS